jgi:hypothetical protein
MSWVCARVLRSMTPSAWACCAGGSDGVQRRAQFVRDRRDEFILGAIQTLGRAPGGLLALQQRASALVCFTLGLVALAQPRFENGGRVLKSSREFFRFRDIRRERHDGLTARQRSRGRGGRRLGVDDVPRNHEREGESGRQRDQCGGNQRAERTAHRPVHGVGRERQSDGQSGGVRSAPRRVRRCAFEHARSP